MSESGGEKFISEPMTPRPGTGDSAGMARGEPGLPRLFTWREQEYMIVDVIRRWKTSGSCRNGADEMYLRRHWYKIVTDPPMIMTVYCDRQAKDRKRPKARWWVYTVEALGSDEGAKGQ